MSVHTGRIGTPPQKSRMHLGGDVLTPLLIVLILAVVTVWVVGMGIQQWNANETQVVSNGNTALYEQRAGEWAVSAPPSAMESRSLYDQRAGEWSAGIVPAVMGVRSLYDQRAGEWSVGKAGMLPGQSALQEQRVGEWTTGQTQPVIVPQMNLDSEWLNRQALARAKGIR